MHYTFNDLLPSGSLSLHGRVVRPGDILFATGLERSRPGTYEFRNFSNPLRRLFPAQINHQAKWFTKAIHLPDGIRNFMVRENADLLPDRGNIVVGAGRVAYLPDLYVFQVVESFVPQGVACTEVGYAAFSLRLLYAPFVPGRHQDDLMSGHVLVDEEGSPVRNPSTNLADLIFELDDESVRFPVRTRLGDLESVLPRMSFTSSHANFSDIVPDSLTPENYMSKFGASPSLHPIREVPLDGSHRLFFHTDGQLDMNLNVLFSLHVKLHPPLRNLFSSLLPPTSSPSPLD